MRKLLTLTIAAWMLTGSARALDFPLQVAKVAANEGALVVRDEIFLVWQTIRVNGGNTDEKKAEWLARHSPRVHKLRECRGSNCVWTPNLDRLGTLPLGLVIDQLAWEIKVVGKWLDLIDIAEWLVRGNQSSQDPCHIPPRTWGGAMDYESAMRDRNLYPIGCRSVKNDGFVPQPKCWVDGLWICNPVYKPVNECGPLDGIELYASM